MRCPSCRKGDVFINPNPYYFKEAGRIHNTCKICGQNFRPEPGFYFGAAVVSYPMTVLFNLLIAFVFYLIVGDIFNHIFSLMMTLIVVSLLALPLTFRYSRILWLHIIFKYKGPVKEVN